MTADPYRVYQTQQKNARRRRIPWQLSFEQWQQVWQASGLWDQRGRSPDGAVLARIDPREGFHIQNIQICTGRAAAQGYWQSPCRPEALAHNQRLAEQNCRTVQTPQGVFPSAGSAAQAIGITASGIHWRIRNWPDRYYYR